MNEKDLEDLLQSMPLKKPTGLPEALPTPVSGVRRLGAIALTAVCFRIPLWASAAAVVLAVGVSVQVTGRPQEMTARPPAPAPASGMQRLEELAVHPTSEKPVQSLAYAREELSRVQGHDFAFREQTSVLALASRRPTEDFWTLPERYQRMIAAARQKRHDKSPCPDRARPGGDTPPKGEGREVR